MQHTLRDATLAQVRQVIAEHGHAVQSELGQGAAPDLCYTVGLTARGLPELVVLGVDQEVAHMLLNVLASLMTPQLASGAALTLALPAGSATVSLAPAPPEAAAQLTTAVALYGTGVRAVQVAFAP